MKKLGNDLGATGLDPNLVIRPSIFDRKSSVGEVDGTRQTGLTDQQLALLQDLSGSTAVVQAGESPLAGLVAGIPGSMAKRYPSPKRDSGKTGQWVGLQGVKTETPLTLSEQRLARKLAAHLN